MAPKATIKKDNSSVANANVIPWPHLPRQLLYFMAKQKDLMIENLGWHGVGKSWRSIPRQCGRCSRNGQTSAAAAHSQQRWFQLSRSDHDEDDDDPRPHVLSIPYLPGFYVWNPRRLQLLKKQGYEYWMHFRGCSNGWIVTETEEQWLWRSRYSLSAPLWRWWGSLPTWDSKFPFKFATVSNKGVMVLTGTTRPAFLIYNRRTHSSGWLAYDSTVIDPYSSEQSMMLFTNAIGFKDRYYALSLQGALAVIEEENIVNNHNNNDNNSQIRFKIAALGQNRAVPSSSSRRFVEYLIESEGEILVAFVISRTKKSDFDDVEVYRLDFGRELLWVKMESIGERALFLGTDCSVSVNAEQVGCRPNCVYFTHKSIKDSSWKEFHMWTGCIVNSTTL